MKRILLLLLAVVLTACAGAPTAPDPAPLFDDALFVQPSQRIDAAEVFQLSDEMRGHIRAEMAQQIRYKGAQRGLIDALYQKGQLKLEYDTTRTRNAAEAFAARSGNCLSLVIMTAAFAKELGLPVRFQSVFVPHTWSRNGDLYFSSGHVNLSLGKRATSALVAFDLADQLTIDFLPPEETRGQRARAIAEDTIVAMYMNNRAAESIAADAPADAYWWAREAVLQSPTFLPAYNTLGVVYTRFGHLRHAERVLGHVLGVEPANTQAMANLVVVLNKAGRPHEAQRWAHKLAQIEPHPPFHFFNLGLAAMEARDFKAARDWFAKEVERAAYYHEFHFWLAITHYALGDFNKARKHLSIAQENSTTQRDRALYAAKLDRLRSVRQ